MDKQKSLFSRDSILILVLAVMAMVVTTVAVIPSLRQPVRDFFTPEARVILAKVTGDITGKGMNVTILKIQLRDSLVLEVYTEGTAGESTMFARIVLPERRDAYFQLRGNATNLGLSDIDNDSVLEILAPTFDEQMVARLNIYKFNVSTQSFDRVNNPPGADF